MKDTETLSKKLVEECKWMLGRELEEKELEFVHWIIERQCELLNAQKTNI